MDEAIEYCVPVLKPLDLMTTVLSGEKYVTLSSVIALVRGLQYSVNTINCTTPIDSKLKGDLLTIIARRLGSCEGDKNAKATFLDSRYKRQGFGSKELADSSEKWVLEELGGIIAEASCKTPDAVDKVRVVSEFEERGMFDIDKYCLINCFVPEQFGMTKSAGIASSTFVWLKEVTVDGPSGFFFYIRRRSKVPTLSAVSSVYREILSSLHRISGSKNEDGVGCAFYDPTTNLRCKFKLNPLTSTYTAEQLAIKKCLDYTSTLTQTKIVIFTDNKSTIQRVRNPTQERQLYFAI
ncbi:hypothetical protein CBL_20883 [Carabus blaptoides fortunei]